MIYLLIYYLTDGNDMMKKLVTGILAHVDSGKTTLSEAILYKTGTIKKHGRVDHKNTFLDTDKIERDRGITIFSKQAVFSVGSTSFTLIDTPGHSDFSSETESAVSVLDYAILVISAPDGVQSHTETLWHLLKHYNIPVFVFINKTDISERTNKEIIDELNNKLCPNFVDFTDENFLEEAAMCTEELMNELIQSGTISEKSIQNAVCSRKIFPCCAGSALKLENVDTFLDIFEKYTKQRNFGNKFGAKVFKLTEDEQGERLTHIKITGGILKVKDIIKIEGKDCKVNQIRIYSGEKFQAVKSAESGDVCAVTGLSQTYAGQGIGCEVDSFSRVIEPVLKYKINILNDIDPHLALTNLKKLEQEQPQLKITWNSALSEIHAFVMGDIQIEVLKRLIPQRFKMEVEFEKCGIAYKETIADISYGVGHYEPLRHYAEVHLVLEPAKENSGLKFVSNCSEDMLDKNYQNLILTHLREKTHIGVLAGCPVTDMKITLVAGRAHQKHTEGGDFRQATYRAVRNGLKNAKSILLEPWYKFTLEVPTQVIGRAMTDITQMGGEFSAPKEKGEMSVIKGYAPVSEIQDYNVFSYSKGKGRLSCTLSGYRPCHNADEVISKIGYDSESDIENTADSIFCSHGAGFNVKWDKVCDYMHVDKVLKDNDDEEITTEKIEKCISNIADDDELMRIFEMTYGPIKRKNTDAFKTAKLKSYEKPYKASPNIGGKQYLLVDGYNIIFAWDKLKSLSDESLDLARNKLINMMCNYQALKGCELILVFDAYKVKDNVGEVEKLHNISIVYTKEAETADMYIEKVTHELGKNNSVRVATSDRLEQLIILGNGAFKISADDFLKDVEKVEDAIRKYLTD